MRAVLTIRGPGAEVVRSSLAPEAGREIPKAQIAVRGDGELAEVIVEAEDVGALRAAVNSYLRWAQLALDVRGASGA